VFLGYDEIIKAALLTPIANKCYHSAMAIATQNRARSGRFLPGQSGNPGGRPKDEHRVAELARSYTLEAIDTLVELMRDGKDERVRGTAAQALLDRGWGKRRRSRWLRALRAAIWTS
jgi:hypothetical protein